MLNEMILMIAQKQKVDKDLMRKKQQIKVTCSNTIQKAAIKNLV